MLCQVVNYLPGKKDIWLPRSGHVVSLEVNSLAVPVSMVLDSAGRGYFPPRAGPGAKKQYRFWSYCLDENHNSVLSDIREYTNCF